jgi:signal transduction histidine kinase/CheY-like chemotaxis protein
MKKNYVSFKATHNVVIAIYSLILFLLLIIPIFATETSPFPPQNKRHIVKIGYYPYAGYFSVDEKGNKEGYGYEYLQNMLPFANWEYEYVGYDENMGWSTTLKILQDGKIDILSGIIKTPEREKIFTYSSKPFATAHTILTVKEGNLKYQVEDYANWSGIKVGMLTDNIRNKSLEEFALSKGFTFIPVLYENSSQRSQALANGTVDAIVSSNFRTLKNEWILAEFDAIPLYFVVKKGNTKLIHEVDYALEQISITQPDLNQTLYKKYFAPQTNREIAFTQQELEFITECTKNHIVFTAIVSPDNRPFSFIEDSNIRGILVDLSKEIFNRAGISVKYSFSENKIDSKSTKEESYASIICDFGTEFSTAEKKGYVATIPYYTTSVSELTRRKFTGQTKIAGIIHEDMTKSIGPNILETVKIKVFNNKEDCVNALLNGSIDKAFLASDIARNIVYSDQTAMFIYSVLPQTSVNIRLGINKNENFLLASVINKTILTIQDTNLYTYTSPYTLHEIDPTLTSLLYLHPQIVISLAVSILIALFSVFFTIYLHKVEISKEKKNIELKKAVLLAEKANHAKTELLSRVSHDIRTPLNAICNMTEFANQDIDNRIKTLDDIDHIKKASVFLLSMINDILDISKIESDKIELHPEPYPAPEFINNIKELIEPMCEEKQQKFVIISESNNETIIADHIRINQIALNLLSNAIKYTPKGGTIKFENILKKNSDDTINNHIIISDNGIGMSDSFQTKMFDSFTQELENPARKKIGEGTGLGLSIVKRIIDIMGGEIKVQSTLNKGTTININFVFSSATQKQLTDYYNKNSTSMAYLTQKLHGTVLLAEDNDINAQIAIRILEKFGLSVQWAQNGTIAINMFKKFKPFECSAILMDMRMPELNGYEATSQIRALDRPDAKMIPIIALTADAVIENKPSGPDTNFTAHIVKPIDPKELYTTLKSYISS